MENVVLKKDTAATKATSHVKELDDTAIKASPRIEELEDAATKSAKRIKQLEDEAGDSTKASNRIKVLEEQIRRQKDEASQAGHQASHAGRDDDDDDDIDLRVAGRDEATIDKLKNEIAAKTTKEETREMKSLKDLSYAKADEINRLSKDLKFTNASEIKALESKNDDGIAELEKDFVDALKQIDDRDATIDKQAIDFNTVEHLNRTVRGLADDLFGCERTIERKDAIIESKESKYDTLWDSIPLMASPRIKPRKSSTSKPPFTPPKSPRELISPKRMQLFLRRKPTKASMNLWSLISRREKTRSRS